MVDSKETDASSSSKHSDGKELEYLLEQTTALTSHLEAIVYYKIPSYQLAENHSDEDNIRVLRSHLEKLISLEAHIQLAKLKTRLLYEDTTFLITPTKKSQEGAVVVVVDALTRRLWVCEEVLAKSLKFSSELLSRILEFLQVKHMVRRFKRMGQMYCSLAYDRIPVVMKYLNLKVEEKLDEDLKRASDAVNLYLCENCNQQYTSLQALFLINPDKGDEFYCERCDNSLKEVSSQLAIKASSTLQRMKDQTRPISMLLEKIEGLPVPNLGTEPALQDIFTDNDVNTEDIINIIEIADDDMEDQEVST